MVAEVNEPYGNEPAFPVTDGTWVHHTGMDMRDWFAGKALAGLLADGIIASDPEYAAKLAYVHADAMMDARKKRSSADT